RNRPVPSVHESTTDSNDGLPKYSCDHRRGHRRGRSDRDMGTIELAGGGEARSDSAIRISASIRGGHELRIEPVSKPAPAIQLSGSNISTRSAYGAVLLNFQLTFAYILLYFINV